MEQYVRHMNEEQRQAVLTTEGPLLIMAGAGSGKTRVLTHRIAYLLGEKEVNPYNILAITFTNKAAEEMKQRVTKLVGEAGKDVFVATFHAMCVRILRRDIDKIGYERNFTIIDPNDQKSVMKDVFKEENIDSKKFEPRTVLQTISNLKNDLITPDEYKKQVESYYDEIVSRCYERYQKKLHRNQSLDFDDLIMVTIELFTRDEDTLSYYQNKFQYIHVDEYQDTNEAQYKLIQLLSKRHKNLCVVGDSDQSIYGWRGANIENILNFENDYSNCKTIFLEQNYRSTKNILNAANEVIRHNTTRKPKALWTESEYGEKVGYYKASSERDEAEFAIREMIKLTEDGYDYNDIAVLYRTGAQSRVFEEMFMKSNIPYKMVGGTKFYDRMEIKDLLAYLRLAKNPHDDISFARVVNTPKRGIGKTSIDKLQQHALIHDISLLNACSDADFIGVSKKATSALIQFVEMIQSFNRYSQSHTVQQTVEYIIEVTQYYEMLAKDKPIEAQSRRENIEEFLTVAKEFDESNEAESLTDFLTELSLSSAQDEVDEESEVTMMTMHAAKGLEFKVVFVVGVEEGLFPHRRALFEDSEMEEERRLMYVAITRAEEQLYLTHASSRTIYGKTQMNKRSRFLDEIPEDLLDSYNVSTRPSYKSKDNNSATSIFQQPKRRSVRPTPNQDVNFNIGDKVQHKSFGQGLVSNIKQKKGQTELDIVFDKVGPKRLIAEFAPIERVEK